MVVKTVGFRCSAVSRISQIHRAIRDGDFEYVEELLEGQFELLGKANAIGWTALHFCCCHEDVSMDQWRWILERTPAGTTKKRTDTGHTCIDHFFQRHLDPPKWQRNVIHEQSKDLNRVLRTVVKDKKLLERVKQSVDVEKTLYGARRTRSDDGFNSVVSFWRKLDMLLRVDHYGKLDVTKELPVVFALSRTSCPAEVIELAISMYSDQQYQRIHNMMPLHSACRNPAPGDLIRVLAEPESASETDIQGRLPLHVALSEGALTWQRGIEALWQANPLFGSPRDSLTKLPALFLACCPKDSIVEKKTNEQAARTYTGMWRFLNEEAKRRTVQSARDTVELEHLETVFELLRADPSALLM